MMAKFIKSSTYAEAKAAFEPVSRMEDFSAEELDALIQAFNTNSQIHGCWALTGGNRYLNFLNRHSPDRLVVQGNQISKHATEPDDEIPF